MSSSTPDGGAAASRLSAAAADAFGAAEQALADETTAAVSDAAVQQLITAGTRLFARKVECESRYFSPLPGANALTPTEAAVLMVELMRAVDLNLFDLSMWAARPRDEAEPARDG